MDNIISLNNILYLYLFNNVLWLVVLLCNMVIIDFNIEFGKYMCIWFIKLIGGVIIGNEY